MSESCKFSVNEFQVDRPAAEKARRPNALSRYRSTTRSRRLADHRCCRDTTSETVRQCSDAWPWTQPNIV